MHSPSRKKGFFGKIISAITYALIDTHTTIPLYRYAVASTSLLDDQAVKVNTSDLSQLVFVSPFDCDGKMDNGCIEDEDPTAPLL